VEKGGNSRLSPGKPEELYGFDVVISIQGKEWQDEQLKSGRQEGKMPFHFTDVSYGVQPYIPQSTSGTNLFPAIETPRLQ
jgi:hypothetical protein